MTFESFSYTLRTLEADGLVSRTVYAEVPPRVEYQLTETGKTLIPHIESLVIIRKTKNQDFKNEKSKKTANDLLIAFIV